MNAENLHADGCGKPWGLCDCDPRPAGKQAWLDRHRAAAHSLAVDAAAFGCRLTDADLVRGCAPEQPDEVEPGQNWMNAETGDTYPVASVRDDVIQKDDRLVTLGTGSYIVMLSESDLRERYVCTDPPRPVTELHRG